MLTKAQQKPHSKLGSISLIAGIVGVIGSCLMLGASVFVMMGSAPSSLNVPGIGVAWTTICAGLGGLAELAGLGCGVVGFFERDTDRMPNILGIILGVIGMGMLMVVVALGFLMAGLQQGNQPNL